MIAGGILDESAIVPFPRVFVARGLSRGSRPSTLRRGGHAPGTGDDPSNTVKTWTVLPRTR